MMKAHPLIPAFCVALASTAPLRAAETITHPYSGITRIFRSETSPRNEHMNIVEVDLTDPGIRFMLSPATPPAPSPTVYETSGQTTLAFINQHNAQLGINVHFFDFPLAGNGGTNLTGFAASNGNVYSAFDPAPVLNYAILPNAPVLNISSTNLAQMAVRGNSDTSLLSEADGTTPISPFTSVSGSAQIITNGAITLPTGIPPRPKNLPTDPDVFFYTDQVAARTGIGLSQDGKTLFLFTVDATGGSVGMKISEMAQILHDDYGVYNALNLDGGGSTTLAMQDPITHIGSVVNASSGGPRAVGTNLAIFAVPLGAVPEPATLSILTLCALTLFRRRSRS